MKNVILCVVIALFSSPLLANPLVKKTEALGPQVNEVINFFQRMSGPVSKAKSNLPNYKTCELDIVNWGLFLLSGKSFEENISFNSKCHMVTKFIPKLGKSFSINIKIFKFLKYKDLKISLTMKRNLFPSQSLELHIHRMVFSAPKQRTLIAKMKYKAILDVTSKDLFSSHGESLMTLVQLGDEKINKKIKINPLKLLR